MLSIPCAAQDQGLIDAIRECARIKDDSLRLAAYDSLAARLLGAQNLALDLGQWRVSKSVSAMDDKEIVALSLEADGEIAGWPDRHHTPTLHLRWKEGELNAYVVTGMTPQVESGGGATVTLRFDKNEAESLTLGKSTDGEALFWREPKVFIEKMLLSERMLLRFTPFNSSPTTTTFKLTGLGESIKPLLNACQWTPSKRSYRRILAEESLRRVFQGSYHMGTRIEGLTLTVETEGNRWRPIFRDDAVVDLAKSVTKKISEALADFSEWQLQIEVHGTTWTEKKSKEGGKPFSSEELAALVRKGVAASIPRTDVTVGKAVEASFYGDDSPEILRGKLKSTGEHFKVVITGIE